MRADAPGRGRAERAERGVDVGPVEPAGRVLLRSELHRAARQLGLHREGVLLAVRVPGGAVAAHEVAVVPAQPVGEHRARRRRSVAEAARQPGERAAAGIGQRAQVRGDLLGVGYATGQHRRCGLVEPPPLHDPGAQRAQAGQGEATQQLQAGLGPDPLGRHGHRLGLDPGFERHGFVDEIDRRTGRAAPQSRQRRLVDLDDRRDRRSGVLAPQLAELPLAAEQPQRIAEQRLQAGGQVGRRASAVPGATR